MNRKIGYIKIFLIVTLVALISVYCNKGDKVPDQPLNLVNGAMVPAGSVMPHLLVLPAGTTFVTGYVLPDGTYVEPVQLTEARTIPAGTVLLGNMVIPAGSIMPNDALLPGSRQYGTFDATISTIGLFISSGAFFDNDTTIPAGSIISGSLSVTTSDLTFPSGTEFPNGYKLPNGEIVPFYTSTSEVTLPAGTLLLGGAKLPQDLSMTIPAGTQIIGILIFTSDLIMPSQGFTLPADTILTKGVYMPPGSNWPNGNALPDGSAIYRGWIKGDDLLRQALDTSTTGFAAPVNSSVIGEVVIPIQTSPLSSALYLPPGTTFDITGKPTNTGLLGAYIPPAIAIPTDAGDDSHDFPEGTLFVGTNTALTSSITFPTGTIFLGGYYDSSASAFVEPFTSTADVTLETGDKLTGGAQLPSGGAIMTVSTGFGFTGAIVIPSCGTSQPATTGTGIMLPGDGTAANSAFVEAGIGRATTNIAAGTTLAANELIASGDKYFIPVDLGSPLAAAQKDQVVITWNTSVSATEEVRYSTNTAPTDWNDCAEVTCQSGCTATSSCGTSHSMTITGLSSDITYYFRIYAGGSGVCGTTQNNTGTLNFTTSPPCAGNFALVSVSDEDPASEGKEAGNFGVASSIASFADFDGRLFIGTSDSTFGAPTMYKTDTSYGTVTTQAITLSNSSFNETTNLGVGFNLYENTLVSGGQTVDIIFPSYYSSSQTFMMGYSDGTLTGTDLNLVEVSYVTGGGTDIPPDRQGFGDNTNNKLIISSHGGSGYIYLGVQNTDITKGAKLYLATTLIDTSNSTNCAGPLIACNFSADDGLEDVFNHLGEFASDGSAVGNQGEQISAITEFNGYLYVSVKNAARARLFRTADIGIKADSTLNDGINDVNWSNDLIAADAQMSINNTDITSLLVNSAGDKMYLTTENANGAQVWTLTTADDFTKIIDFADGTGLNATIDTENERINFIAGTGSTNKFLYFGTEKPAASSNPGFEIWKTDNGNDDTVFSQVGLDGSTCTGTQADSFGTSGITHINARKGIVITITGGTRLFVGVQDVASFATSAATRLYRVDDN